MSDTTTSVDREIEKVLRAIAETPLPPVEDTPRRGPRAPSKAGEKQGFTNRGSLQGFDAELTGQARDDALHWTLFGQLAADAQFDRQTQVDDWYKLYVKSLGTIGMQSGSANWGNVGDLLPSVDETALTIIKQRVPPKDFELIRTVIESLGSGHANEPLNLFNNKASNTSDGNFQVSTGQTDRDGNLIVQIEYFYFSSNQRITNMLFWKWTDKTVSFTQGHSPLTLSKTIADRSRDALVKRLGDRIIQNIEDIPLAS